MKFFITGGCGFIACNLIKHLAGKGHSFTVYDNYKTGKPKDLEYTGLPYKEINSEEKRWKQNEIQVIHGDIMDTALLADAMKDAEVVIHFAANTGVLPSVQDPVGDCHTNVIGTLNALEACRMNNVKRFVFASSGAPVGDENPPPIHEKLPPRPVSPYGASKLAGEGYCSAYYRSFDIDTVALRFGNVYGPGSSHKGSVVAKFIKRVMNGEVIEIYGDGRQTRDFIFIDDLLEAVYKAATVENIGGEIFQVATSQETTVNELTQVLLNALKAEGIDNAKIENIESQKGEVQRNFSDTSKAQERLGWKASTNLIDGLMKTVRFFKSADINA